MAPMRYVFIDESGDLGKTGTRYFVIAALCVDDPKNIERIIKKIRQRKLKKKLKELPELKASHSTDVIRRAVLEKIGGCDCHLHLVILDKVQAYDYLFKDKQVLYNLLAGAVFASAQSGPSKKFHVIIDRKDKKHLLRQALSDFLAKTVTRFGAEAKIEHLDSRTSRGLQAVDFVAWAAYQLHNRGDGTFMDLVKSRVSSDLRLFNTP